MPSLYFFAAFALLASTISAQTTIGDCDEVDNCNARGTCTTTDDGLDWYCICDDGYTTHPAIETGDEDDDSSFCNYAQKKQLTAFLLAWFLGFYGGGQFYIGDTGIAAAKLVCGIIFCCCMPCVLKCVAGKMADGGGGGGGIQIIGCVQCCCMLGLFVWWLVDIVNFGTNAYDDGNGVGLEPW